MTNAEHSLANPVAVQPVPGSDFAVAIVGVAPTTSGPALGSVVAGVGSVAVATVVACLGLAGARDGWGVAVAGAFGVLAGGGGLASFGLGTVAIRQIGRSGGAVRGHGMAVTGLICGAAGVVLTALAFLAAVLAAQ